MIFGVLNPEKIWHQQLVHLPTSPVYCSHFTLGNPKGHFSTVLFIHTSDLLHYLRKKPTVTSLPLHLKNVAPLPCKNCTNSSSFSFFSRVSSTNSLYGRVAEWQRLVATWAEFQQSMVDDTVDQWQKRLEACIRAGGGHFEICCNVACLTFRLPHITTSSFQSHQCPPTTGSFHFYQRLEKRTYLQSDENVVHFTR